MVNRLTKGVWLSACIGRQSSVLDVDVVGEGRGR